MNLEELAARVVEAAEAAGVPFMAVGAIAAGAYGVPRSTKDVDLLAAVNISGGIRALIQNLEPLVEFDPQVVFDTLTWGRRHVGLSRTEPPFKVELFEVFDDPFVQSEFDRRRQVFVPLLGRKTWLPTAEDVVVQKIRWGRSKDIDDARDVLAVQTPAALDMAYIEHWCTQHGNADRLHALLEEVKQI